MISDSFVRSSSILNCLRAVPCLNLHKYVLHFSIHGPVESFRICGIVGGGAKGIQTNADFTLCNSP